jgi:hypothetical protein
VPVISLPAALHRHYTALRHAWMRRHVLRATALLLAGLALALALGVVLPLGPAAAWWRTALGALAALAVLLGAARAQWRRVPRFPIYLERVETRFPELRSWLRNALELEGAAPVGGSPELASALGAEAARRLERTPLAALAPAMEARRPALLGGAALALCVVLGVLAPGRTQRSWATLLDPGAAAPPVTLRVEPGAVRLSPGAALAIRAHVAGTRARPRLAREHGPVAVATLESQDGADRVWRFDLPPVTREDAYRVNVARVASLRFAITLAGEPAPVSFETEYRAPAYARLPVQRGTSTRGDLSALRGTRAHVEVTFDRDLSALDVALPGGTAARFHADTPRRWSGDVPIERDGEWTLAARAGTGDATFRYRVTPLADAPPVIAVRTPASDVDLPAGQQIALDVLGQDDLGLSQLELQYHKDAAAPWTRVGLTRFPGEPREAGVTTRWDASPLGLLPGQTASFRLALYDNNASGRGVSLSPTFELRFPSLSDLYDQVDQQQARTENGLQKAAEATRELQKQLDRLARQSPAPSPQGAQSFERQEEMKRALDSQQEISKKIDDAAQQLHETLQHAEERQAFSDELSRKLRELNQLMNQVQSPEFRQALERMKQALEQMDRQTLEQSLPDWRQHNQETLQNLERSIDLMKRLREEEKLDSFARRADELERAQQALNQQHEAETHAAPTPKTESDAHALAEQQRRAAENTQKLAEDVHEMGQQSDENAAQDSLNAAAQQLQDEAADPQKSAAQSSERQQPQQALEQGRRASQGLQRASQGFQQMARNMRQEREGADVAAVRRAAQDLVSLQRESEQNLDSKAPLPERSDRQTDLSEGVSRVADSLSTLAAHSPFLSPKLSGALGRAMQELSNSGKQMGQGDGQQGEQSGRTASQALNEAVLSLRETESSMCQKPGSQPGGQNHSERMGQLGQQQSQLNEESRSIAQRLTEQMRLSAGDRREMQRMADEQRRIREQLEQMQRDEAEKKQLLGRLDAAHKDMQDVEQSLRDGATGDDLEQKQQRILSRLLDAQRSLNRQDFEPERESRTGVDVSRPSPADLPRDLLRENDRLRVDLLKAEADRYPSQYRAFIEAYLRSLNRARR